MPPRKRHWPRLRDLRSPGARARAVAIGLVLTGACRPGTVTPPAVAPAEPAGDGIDHSAAYAGHEDTGPPEARARVRPEPTPVSSLDAAMTAVRSGNPEGARDFLVTHVEAHPDDRAARLALSRAHAKLGRYADAQTVLEAPGAKPDDPDTVVRRVELMWRRGLVREAETLLEKTRAKHPDDLPVRGELLLLLARTGRSDTEPGKALMEGLYDAYEAGKANSAAELLAVAFAAITRGTTGAFKDANMVLADAEREAPISDGAWVAERILLVRGDMFREKYSTDSALETYGLLLEQDPWHPDALAGSARVYVDALQFAAASRVASEALQVAPEHPRAHAVLARIAVIEGRREEARTRVRDHVLVANPLHTGALAVTGSLALMEADDAAYDKAKRRAFELDHRGTAFFRDLADILAFLHLYPEADVALKEAVALAPKDAYLLSAQGLNLLRLGEETRGREALERAWKRDKFNERTSNTLDLYTDVIDAQYADEKVGDVVVRLPKEDREFVEPALVDSVRGSRKALDAAYGITPSPLQLEFYRDTHAFSVRTVGVPSLGALAVCFGPVITFVGPYAGAYNIDMVVRHELSHTYAIQLSGGRVPRWFTEGLSEWESELSDPAYARESAQLLSAARREGRLRRLSELELAFIRAESGQMMEVAYATAAYAMRYLGNTYGRPKLVAILQGYRDGKETDALFREHLGKPIATVEKEFEKWFFAELDAKVSGWTPSREGEGDARDALFRRAMEQAAANDTATAEQTLQQLLAKDGDGFASRMMLAKLLLSGPTPAAAKDHLQAARKHHPEEIEPLVLLANLARDEGDAGAEMDLLEAALKIDGDSLEPAARLLMLGLVTRDKPRTELARRRVRAIAPLHPISLGAEALRLQEAGKGPKAKKFLARATDGLDLARGPGDTFAVLALAAAALGDKAGATELATAAIRDARLPEVAKKRLQSL